MKTIRRTVFVLILSGLAGPISLAQTKFIQDLTLIKETRGLLIEGSAKVIKSTAN